MHFCPRLTVRSQDVFVSTIHFDSLVKATEELVISIFGNICGMWIIIGGYDLYFFPIAFSLLFYRTTHLLDEMTDIDAPKIVPGNVSKYMSMFYVTTSVSLATNLIVILIHSCMVYHKVAEFNRVTLRLTAVACIFGILRSIMRLAMIEPANSVACLVNTFFLSWMEMASPICLAFVGIHAVFVLVFNVNHPRKFEKYYYIIIVIYSLAGSLVAISHRDRSYPSDYKCWIRISSGEDIPSFFAWTWYYIFLLIPIAVAVVCALILMIRYKMERFNFAVTSVHYAQNKNNSLIAAVPLSHRHVDPIKAFRNVVIRLTGYAIVPLFSKIFIIVNGFATLRGHSVEEYVTIAGTVMADLQGLLISLLYFSDPAMTGTIIRLFRYLRKVYVDDYPYALNKKVDHGSLDSDHHDNINLDHPPDLVQLDSDCRSVNVRLGRSNHDMIADDGSEGRFHLRLSTPRKSYKKKRPYDPYRYHWVAMTMHWFLIKIYRHESNQTSFISSSTLSYHSKSLSPAALTQNGVILAMDTRHGSNDGENMDQPFLSDISKDSYLPVSPTTNRSSPSPLSSSEGSMDEGDHPLSSNLIASLGLMRPSKKLSKVMRQHSSQQPTEDSSLHHTTSQLSAVAPSEEHIDRLSLLSGSLESPRPNVCFAPLNAPPQHATLPILSITLPDQPWSEPPPSMTTCSTTSPSSPSASPHGVAMDSTSVLGLLDWEPTNPFPPARQDPLLIDSDGLGHGWTSLIHLQHSWIEDSRTVVFVQHWVKGYLGSRWFVAE